MANQPASGVSYSADGKTLIVHGDTLNYVFPYRGVVPVQASDLTSILQAAIKQPSAGSLGSVGLTQTDGKGGTLWVLWQRASPDDTPPTVTYNGAPVAVASLQALVPG